jgi:hypothetical protein
MVLQIADEFGMSHEDPCLAFDRVQGGIVRALSARLINCPNRDKDPLAWLSFHETWQTLPTNHQSPDSKESGGAMAGMVELCTRTSKPSSGSVTSG